MENNSQQTYEKQVAQQAQKKQNQQARQSIIAQIMTPQAKQRLTKIKLVKPDKALAIENSLIQVAQSGKLKNRVTEEEFVTLLETESHNKIESKFKRRGIDDQW